MYESRATISPLGMDKIAEEREGKINGLHTLMWTLFGDHPDRDRDFQYVLEDKEEGLDEVFIRSHREPKPNRFFDFQMVSQVQPEFEEGQKFLFRADINPTITKRHEQDDGSVVHADHDIFTNERVTKSEGERRSEFEVLWEWWERKQDGKGFILEDLQVEFRYQYALSGNKKVSIMRVAGHMTVDDPVKFQNLHESGIGNRKDRGCGLVLLRRAQ